MAQSMRGVHVRTLLDIAPDLDIDQMARDLLSDMTSGVVVFDKSNDVIARVFGSAAPHHGAAFVALPHGEQPYVNTLTNIDSSQIVPPRRHDTGLYDLAVVSSDFALLKYANRRVPISQFLVAPDTVKNGLPSFAAAFAPPSNFRKSPVFG